MWPQGIRILPPQLFSFTLSVADPRFSTQISPFHQNTIIFSHTFLSCYLKAADSAITLGNTQQYSSLLKLQVSYVPRGELCCEASECWALILRWQGSWLGFFDEYLMLENDISQKQKRTDRSILVPTKFSQWSFLLCDTLKRQSRDDRLLGISWVPI